MAMKHESYRFTEEHEWVSVKGGMGIVGITDYAQKQLGDIVYVELPEVGRMVEKGKEIGSIESVKAVADIYSPVTGEVLLVNEALQSAPDLLNRDPYGEGWIAKISLADPGEISSLMDLTSYEKFVEEEAKK
ncbi:MAG: glycine cleavage system protein GcvH [Acidobacteriota bacterium]